jgi:SpoIID/LytB domain protein
MAAGRAKAHIPRVPHHAALDPAAPHTRVPRRPSSTSALSALAAALLLFVFSSGGTLASTTATPNCDAVNLRTGPSTTYTKKTSVNTGAVLTVAATVTGGSYATSCLGVSLSGSSWYRFSAINGKSVSSQYGVTYVYGASKLFKTVTTPTPTSTQAPTAAPTVLPTLAAPTTAPTAAPTTAPTDAPTSAPSASPDASASPAPTASPVPTATPGPTPTPNPVRLPSTITFYGRGYGHGVGMSQDGARGRALDGQSAETILAHYYKGTSIGTMANSTVRVLVLQSFAATASNPVQVYGRGATWSIDGVANTFPADARLRFTPTVSGLTTTWKVLVTSSAGATLYSGASASNIRIRSGAGTLLQLWSTPSAYDRFRNVLRLVGATNGTSNVYVVNELPMESYLRGVVPSEISASWPIESLKAQAISARAYAEYRLHPTTGSYDVYNDTRSQVYLGYLAEKTATNSAIGATAGKVLRTSTGAKVTALFHASDGGWTENNENVFTSSTGAKTAGVYSYLRGSSDRRPDGTSYDDSSPYATWHTNTYTLAQLQAWFAADSRSNVGTLVALDLRNRGVSGRLISVTLIGANGTTKQVSGAVFESIFNAHRPSGDPSLRSTLFDLIPIP